MTLKKTPPYTPELNGMVERENRTVQTKANAMMTAAGMGKEY